MQLCPRNLHYSSPDPNLKGLASGIFFSQCPGFTIVWNHTPNQDLNHSFLKSLHLSLLRQNVTQQTQAAANRNARSKQWQPWLAACQRKRVRFLRFSFTQRTQRKRLRLNGNRDLQTQWYIHLRAQWPEKGRLAPSLSFIRSTTASLPLSLSLYSITTMRCYRYSLRVNKIMFGIFIL